MEIEAATKIAKLNDRFSGDKRMFKESDLRQAWSVGITIVHNGICYRVGKMSYGDFFLEPGEPQGETKPFNDGTLWLKLVDKEKRLYGIDFELDEISDENANLMEKTI